MNDQNAIAEIDPSGAVYDRVVREARHQYGDVIGEDEAERIARDAVDEFLVRRAVRVQAFVPVLAMRRVRESVPAHPVGTD